MPQPSASPPPSVPAADLRTRSYDSAPRVPRVPSLDGLRGVAALVVVAFHVPVLSPVFDSPASGVHPEDPSWWLTHTPAYLLWAGPEAVFLFFVLSGFVLALPATVAPVRWRAYVPQRLVRLLLPVWASLVLAGLLSWLVPRRPQPALSDWYASHVPSDGIAGALSDGLLLFGTGWLNSPLWSLQWELVFSLLLPAYLLVARSLRRLWLLELLALPFVVALAAVAGPRSLFYLAMFGFGVVLAFERDRLLPVARLLADRRAGTALAVVCALLLSVEAALLTVGVDRPAVRAAAAGMQLTGACLALVLALHWEPARRRLSAPWAQWVGARSFSLYLVHEPIAVSSGALFPELPVLVHLLGVLPLSLLVADRFSHAVERPAQRLSRRAARALS